MLTNEAIFSKLSIDVGSAGEYGAVGGKLEFDSDPFGDERSEDSRMSRKRKEQSLNVSEEEIQNGKELGLGLTLTIIFLLGFTNACPITADRYLPCETVAAVQHLFIEWLPMLFGNLQLHLMNRCVESMFELEITSLNQKVQFRSQRITFNIRIIMKFALNCIKLLSS